GEPFLELLGVPAVAGSLERGRIVEAGIGSRLPAEDGAERRADAIGLERVAADAAALEHGLALGRLLRKRRRGAESRQRGGDCDGPHRKSRGSEKFRGRRDKVAAAADESGGVGDAVGGTSSALTRRK